jgi:hypothetical protein
MDTYQPLLQKLKARVEVRTQLLLIVLCACVLEKKLVHSLMSARTYNTVRGLHLTTRASSGAPIRCLTFFSLVLVL